MIDKELLKLLGGNKKYIFCTVALQVMGMLANIGTTACVCFMIWLLTQDAKAAVYLCPAILAVCCVSIRYAASRFTGDIRDLIGRKVKKDLREKTYEKIVRLGVRSSDGMSMAGLTQVSMEGIEQLDLYYSSYIPQFFFSMLAPFFLFFICVWIDWRVAAVLLCCVPLIPVSIQSMRKRFSLNTGASTPQWVISFWTACKDSKN